MADIVTGKIFVDGEKGITATKMNQIIGQAVIQPAFYTGKATSATLDPTDTLLELKSSGSYAQVTGAQFLSSVSSQVNVAPQIYTVRMRSFNAIGNPTFEIDARNVGNSVTYSAGTQQFFQCDRWVLYKAGATMVLGSQRTSTGPSWPGTSFLVSNNRLAVTLLTQQATLAATDLVYSFQMVEAPRLRELLNDVTSLQLLCYCTQAPVTFAVSLRDPTGAYSIVYPFTLSTTGWTIVPFPNIPVWTSSIGWSTAPGAPGYSVSICLACGSTYVAPSTGVWIAGNYLGVSGMTNFASLPVNSAFVCAFIQHEPGSVCSAYPIDLSYAQNLEDCQRYYAKSWEYGTAVATATNVNRVAATLNYSTTFAIFSENFPKPMAKAPTLSLYSDVTGTGAAVRDSISSADKAVAGTILSTKRISQIQLSAAGTLNGPITYHYTADTGW